MHFKSTMCALLRTGTYALQVHVNHNTSGASPIFVYWAAAVTVLTLAMFTAVLYSVNLVLQGFFVAVTFLAQADERV